MEHSWMENEFVRRFEKLIFNNPQHVVWAGDYADNHEGKGVNTYNLCKDKNKLDKYDNDNYPLSILDSLFVINHTKKLFVNKIKVINNDGWRIHPLPLLTAESNGRGGGDYYPKNRREEELVGSWCGDLISVSSVRPRGYKELKFKLVDR